MRIEGEVIPSDTIRYSLPTQVLTSVREARIMKSREEEITDDI